MQLPLIYFLLASFLCLSCFTNAQKTTLTPPPLLTLSIPPTQALPNPQTLPPRTFATLTTANLTLTAPFRRSSTFEFHDPPPGSYLCEIWTNLYAFVPMRVDVSVVSPADAGNPGAEGAGSKRKRVDVWQTFRGNEWDNKGEKLGGGVVEQGGVRVTVGVLSQRDFYETRQGFSPLSLLKNPMILIGGLGMLVMFGMPKILENMDPQMREEFEKQQRSNTLANTLSGGGSGGFDAAAWLAGSSAEPPPAPSKSTGNEAKSGNAGKARRRG